MMMMEMAYGVWSTEKLCQNAKQLSIIHSLFELHVYTFLSRVCMHRCQQLYVWITGIYLLINLVSHKRCQNAILGIKQNKNPIYVWKTRKKRVRS